MRREFHSDLLEVGRILVSMAEAGRIAMRNATVALLDADLAAAERVVARDDEIDGFYHQVEEKVNQAFARQAPVAGDLRMLLTALHVAGDLERMGDLAEHVAKSALRRYPAPVVPAELRPVISQMGTVAERIAGKITLVLSSPDAVRAAELERDDDAMDELERQLFRVLLGPHWSHGVEAAVDAALLGRFYERFADHAVNAGERIVYLVTGQSASS